MDRFVKKLKLTNDVNANVNDNNLNLEINIKQSTSISDKSLNFKVKRKYTDDYLCFGFTWNGNTDCPLPICIVCGEKLSNEAMVPNKLKRHLTTIHPSESLKTRLYFERLLNSYKRAASGMVKRVIISDKALEASFKVTELMAKNMISHVIGEKLIGPACLVVVESMLSKESKDVISKVPLSNNIISRLINEMADDINDIVLEKLKIKNYFHYKYTRVLIELLKLNY
ncbi:zinc finger BED domain-containing protein 5-like isoform X1 [Acyrthosiphon pisum]|uniref:Uncharacterized protein n=1 Tax=Acyrthosiphon pisum TaxID=7029 RepID=A0A8R2JRM4_ACYPI|nr:zinc finger BED domain-containing protein 5-like isoform X1 [Acyrthosiphon pisum]